MRRPPKFTNGYVDRHGKPRWYFRRKGFAHVPLPGLPWSPEFMAAYEAAASDAPRPREASPLLTAGTISALAALYYASLEFKRLKPITQSTYRNIIEPFRDAHGDKPVKGLEPGHVRAIIAAKAETPVAANNLLGMLRMLMKLAVEEKWRTDDPTAGVKKLKRKSVQGFRTWSEDEIATFEAKFPLGTRAHLAFQLLLHTGQRRADVVRMGRQHIRDGVLTIRQSKTDAEVTLPLHPNLQAAIDALPRDQLTFLMTAQGRPFTPAGFTNWFHDLVEAAGLPAGLSPHGIRKAVSVRLAEAGCTPHDIMAVTGHRTLTEILRYTHAADRVRSAATAMGRIRNKSDYPAK